MLGIDQVDDALYLTELLDFYLFFKVEWCLKGQSLNNFSANIL